MRFLLKVKADLGSGMSGPNGYKRITEVDFGEDGLPEELEPYKAYPWSSKSKDSYPVDAPDMPIITDRSFPFRGQLLKRIPFKRSEDRVNKNPNTKQTFVKRAMNVAELKKMIKAAEEGIPEEGPKAPPKVPGQEPTKQMFFPEFLTKAKQAFPGIKETFTHPPTYIWNPKEEADKIDIQKIKNILRMKFPEIVWSANYEGNDTTVVSFPDNTQAVLTIGQDANHLTITYQTEGD
jgi:hypothetical protein